MEGSIVIGRIRPRQKQTSLLLRKDGQQEDNLERTVSFKVNEKLV